MLYTIRIIHSTQPVHGHSTHLLEPTRTTTSHINTSIRKKNQKTKRKNPSNKFRREFSYFSYLHDSEFVIDQAGQASNWHYEEFHTECVVVTIVRCLELHVDQVDGNESAQNVDGFHGAIVHRDEGCEQIQIASDEDHREQDLTLPGYTCTPPPPPEQLIVHYLTQTGKEEHKNNVW